MTTASERDRGPVYLDASALAKLYLPEPGSGGLERRLLGRRDLFVSDLTITEFASAVAPRRRQGEFPEAAAGRLYRRILDDLNQRRYLGAPLTPEVHRAAERILMTSGPAEPLRALDALHLALALENGASTLLTFDERLAVAAARRGLTT